MDGWNQDNESTNHTKAMNYVRNLSDDEARFVMLDCQAAIKANPENKKAGHYTDIALYCAMKLKRNSNMFKLQTGDKIEVVGFVMLEKLDPGFYKIGKITEHYGNFTYNFLKPKGKKVIVRHYCDSVDPWVKSQDNEDLNKIVKL